MFRFLRLISLLVLATAIAEGQGNLSDLFSILRTEGPTLTESGRTRTFQIIDAYATGKKTLDGEWQAINDALNDSSLFVRDQACAALAAIIYVNSTPVYVTPVRRIRLPDPTRELVIQRFSESKPNLRENAVRIIALMEGGVPSTLVPQLLQMARTDSEGSVRRAVIGALASVPMPAPEITEFWIQTLNDVSNRELRGYVLSAFRLYAPADPQVIALVIDALRDTDYFVRQEAIASVIKIGKPAVAALPLLSEIRDAHMSANERDQAMRMNAESAIRILSGPLPNR
jgi:HEAT repeat protein